MKKILSALIMVSFLASTPIAEANSAPAADVSCSLTPTGVSYGVSIVFGPGALTITSLTYQWDYAIATRGLNPQSTASYGPRTTFSTTQGNALNLTYESMLQYAKGDPGASILIFANSVFSDGISTITNKSGKGCYVDLPTVLNNVQQAVTQQAENSAAAKAAEEAIKAQIEEAERTVAANSLATDRTKVENLFQVLLFEGAELNSVINQAISKYPSLKGNLSKFLNSRPKVPNSITSDLTVTQLESSLAALTAFRENFETFVKSQSKNIQKTITCIKGKSTKKVTSSNPKCPSGYKRK